MPYICRDDCHKDVAFMIERRVLQARTLVCLHEAHVKELPEPLSVQKVLKRQVQDVGDPHCLNCGLPVKWVESDKPRGQIEWED